MYLTNMYVCGTLSLVWVLTQAYIFIYLLPNFFFPPQNKPHSFLYPKQHSYCMRISRDRGFCLNQIKGKRRNNGSFLAGGIKVGRRMSLRVEDKQRRVPQVEEIGEEDIKDIKDEREKE